MKWLRAGFLLVGVAALTWLIIHLGPAEIWRGLRRIGWGLAIGSALHLAALVLDSLTLRAVIAGTPPPFLLLVRASISGHAINEATPGGKVGELTKFAILEEALPRRRAASALVAQNLVMFVINCGLIALAPLLAILMVGGHPKTMIGFTAVGLGFLVAGGGILFVLERGVGRWPFAALKRFRLSAARVDRWERHFDQVEREWRAVAHDRHAMTIAWASAVTSRLCNVAESTIYFWLAGGDHAVAGGFLSLAGSQAIGWILFFVPFQAGTGEGGAYALFEAAGLSSHAALVSELARKLRRVAFITLGVVLLVIGSVMKGAPRATSRSAT
jgi:hypothetical protein